MRQKIEEKKKVESFISDQKPGMTNLCQMQNASQVQCDNRTLKFKAP